MPLTHLLLFVGWYSARNQLLNYFIFQEDRADNVLTGTKQEMLEQIRADIRDFKEKKNLDKVIETDRILFNLYFSPIVSTSS